MNVLINVVSKLFVTALIIQITILINVAVRGKKACMIQYPSVVPYVENVVKRI